MHTQTVDPVHAHCFTFAPADKAQAASMAAEQPQAYLRFTMAMNKFCETVRGFPGVKKIGFKARGESISAWTFVDDPTPETLGKIYAAEMELMNAIPNILFDFAVKFDNSPEPPGSYILMA
ncbi:MAG TPA: hypothetical protein DCS05_02425 [Nitrospiraceae bacterium]|nr:hypothetical protein [Nitrospiraceae bacterium]